MNYVEMTRDLSQQSLPDAVVPSGLKVKSLREADMAALYQCYTAAFSAGDAQFFFDQDDAERRVFFDTLGYEAAVGEAASLIFGRDERLIGFSYVLPYGEGNCHISCMCIHPDWQSAGLGKLLLHLIMQKAADAGYKTISLGTEKEMRAFQLYRQNGFAVR
ncbi:MAG: GNAT family N-acetyltransferase [Chloroflexi bacterium]|nr:GNAT family N-acetyltransferase [Chloroflexota bacterium]